MAVALAGAAIGCGGEGGSGASGRGAAEPDVPEREAVETLSLGEIEGGTARMFFYAPYGPRHLLAFAPDGGWASAVSSEYRVTLVGPGGDSTVVSGAVESGPPLSDDERARAEEAIASDRERAGDAASEIGFEVPDRKQPLRQLFDDAGRLWVELSVGVGAPRRADVYGPDGALLERRTWSGDVDLTLPGWVGDDVALGVRTDSLGVQRVVRLEWR